MFSTLCSLLREERSRLRISSRTLPQLCGVGARLVWERMCMWWAAQAICSLVLVCAVGRSPTHQHTRTAHSYLARLLCPEHLMRLAESRVGKRTKPLAAKPQGWPDAVPWNERTTPATMTKPQAAAFVEWAEAQAARPKKARR